MLPYLIAGAIGYVVAKLFEDETPKFADGGLIAPNGKPSNLTYNQYKLVRTYEFKAWFGDWQNDPANASKVVDENGEPLVVFHGTKKGNIIDQFYKRGNAGIHFGTKKSAIERREQTDFEFEAEYNLIPVFLSIKNPIKTNKDFNWEWEGMEDNNDENFNLEEDTENDLFESYMHQKGYNIYAKNGLKSLEELLSENAIDGVFYKNKIEDKGSISYVVTESNQIKLADGTNTTFDSNNPDIRFDGGGRVSNYKQFYDNLQIEDGSKYIGQKFANVFPFIGKRTSPADIRIYLKEYNNLLSRLENDNYTTKGLKTADLNRLEKRQKYIDKNKYLSRFYLDPSGRIINFDNSDNAYASGGGIDSYYEELKPEVDYYSVNYDDMDGQKFRDNIFDTLTEAKELFNKLCVTGKTFERVDINTIELVAFYENGLYEVLDSKAFINTYPKFLNNLQIEDGSKYIGQKFTDVFPYLKRSDFTPYKFKIKVKRYNNILRRLSEDNYSTKSMKTADLNRLEKIEPTIEKVKYLSKFFCDNSKTILSFNN